MYRILVVDDDPAVLSCYGRLLQRAGHTVESAHGGTAALARLTTSAPFDVVIHASMVERPATRFVVASALPGGVGSGSNDSRTART